MFEKSKAKAIVDHTIQVVDTLLQEFHKLDFFPDVDNVQLEAIYIAIDDYFLFLHKQSKIGDFVLDIFKKTRCTNIPEDYMQSLLQDLHSKYHDIVKAELAKDEDNGFENGFNKINEMIADMINADYQNEEIKDRLDWILANRYFECKNCK